MRSQASSGTPWDAIRQRAADIAGVKAQVLSALAELAPNRLIQILSRLKARLRRSRASRRLRPLAAELFPAATTHELLSASADAAVFRVNQPLGSPIILKVASSSEATEQLRREAEALNELGGIAELGDWRSLIASVKGRGKHDLGSWLTQSAIAGTPTSTVDIDTDTLILAAAAALTPLHEATSRTVTADDELLDRIVSKPFATVAHWRPDLTESLATIDTHLKGRLRGRPLRLSRLHGDFAPENVIWDIDASTICGIVDWEFSEDDLPPEIDLVHYGLGLGAQRRRAEYGEMVIWLLNKGAGSPESVSIRTAATRGPNGFDVATGLTLTWLHHVSFGLQKSIGHRSNPIWLGRNIEHVVASLRDDATRSKP